MTVSHWVGAILATTVGVGCGGLRVHLHRASVQKPSNVALYYSVETSGGDPVPDLMAESFRIYEDDQLISPYESKQTILNPEVAVVHYTMLLLDLSGSITESGSVPLLQEAAGGFAERVSRLHQVGVAGFDGRERIIKLADFSSNGARVRGSLDRLSRFKPQDPSTNLNGAIVEATKRLERQLERAKQPLRFGTLVVFTDGSDRAHRVSESEMLSVLEQSRINVFVIGVGGEIDAARLGRIAKTNFVKADAIGNLGTAFDRVAEFIEASARKFYLLSYCSPARAGVHQLRVEVLAGEQSGSLEHQFNADGFGPRCDPNRKPNFPIGRIRMPAGT